jgi:two-component sensor histidine kinase
MRDMTAHKEQDERLRRSLEEKSMLVREIHHRVKNNLQVIVSLLSLQSGHTRDPHLLEAFEETEGRVRAIAHIHERLYASEDLTEIEFASYLTRLTNDLVGFHTTVPDSVTTDVQVNEMVLPMEQAIPLGLIANELIVNSLKHGRQDGTGHLDVRLTYLRDPAGPAADQGGNSSWAELRIADRGPGLPKDLDLSSVESMGYRLINLLVSQLRGRLEIGEEPGANVAVTFPVTLT